MSDGAAGQSEPTVVIRPAVVTDCVQLHANLEAINLFEKRDMTLPQLSVADLERDGFGPERVFWALVADRGGELIGHAIYTLNWAGYDGIGRCLFLADLFVRESARRLGVGRRLMRALAAAAVRRGAPHIDFTVYGWNEPALRFYRSLGGRSATDNDQLTCYYCDQTAVRRLAAEHEKEVSAADSAAH
ncbi:Diamine acetyltransferase 1 [Amphibalanus amphitrite]|uniref:Diamine acetyltransferase 1 n=1 Tax=Amphibalanus amphitrite TaxID=1232801 RepID=A0A6A4X229_AMPAM|nr:Diamine acetyltransferase 1 [Amphibalanus amphitrite]